MKTVSLVMIVKNEEAYIKRCLESAKQTVDEMIVVDTGSTDNTKAIAQQIGAKVYDYKWNNSFSEARNYSLSLATSDWILMLDADEILSKNYRSVIQKHINKPTDKIGRLKIISKFEEDGLIQQSFAYISRLFPNGIQFKGKIHEQLDTNMPREIINIEVLHDGYFQTDKTERNIPLLMEELKDNPNDSYFLYQIGKEYRKRNDYQKTSEFFGKSYELLTRNESYAPSLIVEYIQSLTKAEQYKIGLEIIHKEEKLLSAYPDFFFSKGILLMNYLSNNPNAEMRDIEEIERAFLRCLQIGEHNKYDSIIGTGSFLPAYNLAILYELLGLNKKAMSYLKQSASLGFEPAKRKLNNR